LSWIDAAGRGKLQGDREGAVHEKGVGAVARRKEIIAGICLETLCSLAFWQNAGQASGGPDPDGQATLHAPNALAAVRQVQPASMIDVRSYGAKGDGVADDTFAVRAAEEALSEGDILVFSKGTYRIADAITIDANAVVVRFDDARIYVVGNTDAFKVKATGVRFLGGEIYSDGQAAGHGVYGINLFGDNCIVDGTRIHDIHASAIVSRGVNNVIRNIRVENVGWDMGLCRGGSKRTVWENCWCNNVGRSAVACDDKAEDTQVIGCYALNPGNTTYVNQQHNVFHFEDCNNGLVQNCTVHYTAVHDYCSHTDSNMKAVVARHTGKAVVVNGLTVILEAGFHAAPAIPLLADYGQDTIPLRVSNVRVYNSAQEGLTVSLQSADMEWQNWYVSGILAVTQSGAASSVMRMDNVHIDGRNQAFSFYYPRYGYDPNGVITNCTFEDISGWAIAGHFDRWKITNNIFRNVDGVALLAQSNDPAKKSKNTVIVGNVFEDCVCVLWVGRGITAEADGNIFRGNAILGKCGTIYYGEAPGTSVYWRDNTKAQGAAWVTLAVNNGFALFDTLRSQYDNPP
jgi:hypothetical protein